MIAVQQFAGPAVKSGPALLDLLLRPGKHCLAVRFGLGALACGGFRFRVALLLGAGLQVRSLGLCLCKDLLGLRLPPERAERWPAASVFLFAASTDATYSSAAACAASNTLFSSSAACAMEPAFFNMDLPFLQLGRQGSVFCPELVLALLESQNDLD